MHRGPVEVQLIIEVGRIAFGRNCNAAVHITGVSLDSCRFQIAVQCIKACLDQRPEAPHKRTCLFSLFLPCVMGFGLHCTQLAMLRPRMMSIELEKSPVPFLRS